MRICFLGEYSGMLDEGMRKVSYHFAKEVSKNHHVLTLDLRAVFTKSFLKNIKGFNPDVIHYIHGPSMKSFILLKMISLYYRNAKTVMSAMHPGVSFLSKAFIPLLKPNIILVQSYETEELFKKLGCLTEFLPCGIDIETFKPATARAKEELREKYGIDTEKFVILHIGSIKEGRNVQLLEKLQKGNNQVLIIGAVSTGVEKNLAQQLEKSGCFVWAKYIKNIEEIYALSDCYLFPTPPMNKINSIEMPLSVLEAMACNIPVISTKFGALPRVFGGGDGLYFIENENNIFQALKEIQNGSNVNTRAKTLPYSWESIGKRLNSIYNGVTG